MVQSYHGILRCGFKKWIKATRLKILMKYCWVRNDVGKCSLYCFIPNKDSKKKKSSMCIDSLNEQRENMRAHTSFVGFGKWRGYWYVCVEWEKKIQGTKLGNNGTL